MVNTQESLEREVIVGQPQHQISSQSDDDDEFLSDFSDENHDAEDHLTSQALSFIADFQPWYCQTKSFQSLKLTSLAELHSQLVEF